MPMLFPFHAPKDFPRGDRTRSKPSRTAGGDKTESQYGQALPRNSIEMEDSRRADGRRSLRHTWERFISFISRFCAAIEYLSCAAIRCRNVTFPEVAEDHQVAVIGATFI